VLRLAKFIVFLGFVVLFLATVAFGFIFILSGGNPLGYARTEYLRITLAGRQEDLARPVGTNATDVIIEVSLGDTPSVIADTLLLNDLVLDKDLFVTYARVESLDTQFEAGTYFLNQTMTIPEIALILTDSSRSSILFRVAEGWRIEEIADAVDEQIRFSFSGAEFLALAADSRIIAPNLAAELGIPVGVSLEGFMFPDTYILAPNITAAELVERLLEGFLEATGTQLRLDANEQGLTMRNIVTLASIIEREAVWEDEHPLIASVYRNRLDIDMNLEADPTVQYGIDGARGRWWPQITRADYRGIDSFYNTYLYGGLPPGPIANPSLSAIRAAVYPAESSYIFFRARCDGSNYHSFATTYADHLANGC
jgi:peptidoglycan lytic transglycosylase G